MLWPFGPVTELINLNLQSMEIKQTFFTIFQHLYTSYTTYYCKGFNNNQIS